MNNFQQNGDAPPPYPGLAMTASRLAPAAVASTQPAIQSTYANSQPLQPTSPQQPNNGARLQELCNRYEIGPDFASKLRLLGDVDIVVVADDSGSMTSLTKVNDDPYSPMQSRWDELKMCLFQIVDIALLFEQNGIDVHFLNRTGVDQNGRHSRLVLRNVTQRQTIEEAFRQPPSGFTPLARTVKAVFDEKQATVKEKRLLCLICTDGEPTNDHGAADIDGFRQVLATRTPIDRIYVNIMACSDDKFSMKYLERLDKTIKNLDVTEHFSIERDEVMRNNPGFSYSIGDHIVKTLVGSLDPYLDQLDNDKCSCCTLQ